MIIFPAIDIIGGEAVRLFKGDYNQKTVYGRPADMARTFKDLGSRYIHIVDLDGAKSGSTPNIDIIKEIAGDREMFIEVGGGIRSMDTIERYLESGASRVILGTAAIKNEALLVDAVKKYNRQIAVGADILDGTVRINGWLDNAGISVDEFFMRMEDLGVSNIICTDISKDGAMMGTSYELYRELSQKYSVSITASGGISSLEEITALKALGLYGAIVGKAYYNGAISLFEAIEVAK